LGSPAVDLHLADDSADTRQAPLRFTDLYATGERPGF
jgi:hypothetical protein